MLAYADHVYIQSDCKKMEFAKSELVVSHFKYSTYMSHVSSCAFSYEFLKICKNLEHSLFITDDLMSLNEHSLRSIVMQAARAMGRRPPRQKSGPMGNVHFILLPQNGLEL